ncbi:MAG: histidinol-phosphatase HisJ family protein [Zhenhengia sp.]|uniref:histidinol-phosphatase HisJ family protein n=1 Tax=Zhenhengia sp. TaxID=2944208 RepID=UPI0029128A3D|nr:histidinol-phosphatase HisJ family protein [Clostridiales bacterium]MDU6973687.1 histidinol-phosphatase HisJ family protein [Clostridiales bacterium]
MYKADYHMHTALSIDCNASIESQIESAIKKGFSEIAITDHFEYDFIQDKWALTLDLPSYIDTIRTYQEKYKERICIKRGVEVGFETCYKQEIEPLLKDKNFDFIICSTHKCDMQELALGGFFIDKEQKEAYTAYFDHVLDTLRNFDNFDVYGHLDYVNRYGKYPVKILTPMDYREQIDEILQILISKGKGLEVNTSGIRYGLGHFNPQIPVLRRYLELGGEIITIGSDSHCNEHVGFLWEEAARMLKNIGFKYYATFENRKPILKLL